MELTLKTTLATILTQLANFFGMTTEVIMQNAPYWLAKYGAFMMMQNMIWAIVLAMFIVVAIMFFIYIPLALDPKHPLQLLVIVFIVSIIICCSICYGQYAIAPEIYGLNNLIA